MLVLISIENPPFRNEFCRAIFHYSKQKYRKCKNYEKPGYTLKIHISEGQKGKFG